MAEHIASHFKWKSALMIVSLLILALALSNPAVASHTSADMEPNHIFNYIVVIVLENHNLGDIINNPSAPFLNQLASHYTLATNYTGIAHPSLPNYLTMISGQDFLSWSQADCGPAPGCNAGSSLNLVDRLESRGLTWKAYMEDYPSTCGTNCSPGGCFLGDTGTGQYAARHDPFIYFGDISNSSERCSRIVPANSGGHGAPDDLLLSDLASPSTASNFIWLTPNLCNDVHDCPLSTGDNYLARLVPQILSSNLFVHRKAALFITFDEGNGDYPTDYLYSVWTGAVAKTGFESSNPYSHYSFLSTLEKNWHLKPLTTNDASAVPMTEFFQDHHRLERHGDVEARDIDKLTVRE